MGEYSDPHGGLPPTVPPPDWVENVTCYSPLLVDNRRALENGYVSPVDVLKAFMILFATMASLVGNFGFFCVLNTRYYRKWITAQPRFILSALAINDFSTGALVTVFGIYPALFECWPLGQSFCQIQALLRGSLSQHSSLVLILLAAERYMASVHPFSYNTVCNKQICLLALLASWLVSVAFYSVIVLRPAGFHFNTHGLMLCEPYPLSDNTLILASCLFYFPTTMILMYCYGTIFHSSKANPRYRKAIFATFAPYLARKEVIQRQTEKFLEEKRRNDLASRSAAAISVTFIIFVTPWAIQQVITSCTRTKSPPAIDFFVSWLAASHTFWSPLIYAMLNERFRRAAQRFLIRTIMCRALPLDWDYSSESSPAPIGLGGNKGHAPNDCPHEQHWGEILEKSFSAHNSLLNIFEGVSPPREMGVAEPTSSASTSVSCPHGLPNMDERVDRTVFGSLPKPKSNHHSGIFSDSEDDNVTSPF